MADQIEALAKAIKLQADVMVTNAHTDARLRQSKLLPAARDALHATVDYLSSLAVRAVTAAETEPKPGAVMQLNPATVANGAFAGCMLVVTEVKTWGVQGYVQALGETRDAPGGQAYYRAKWIELGPVIGMVEWAPQARAMTLSNADASSAIDDPVEGE